MGSWSFVMESLSETTIPDRALADRGEAAGVPIQITLQIVLVLRLGLPEGAGGLHSSDHLARPQARGVDVGNRLQSDLPMLGRLAVDAGTVVAPAIVTLPVGRAGIVDQEEELQQRAPTGACRTEHHFERLAMRAVIAMGGIGIGNVAVADACTIDAREPAHQVLYAPEATSEEEGSLF